MISYEKGNFNQIGTVADEKEKCLINVDKQVIENMQADTAYAKKVDSMLKDYSEIFDGFMKTCEEEAKSLSTEDCICTVGAVTTRLVDDGGKPAIVTAVKYEYTEREKELTVKQKWDGSKLEIEHNRTDQIMENIEDAIEEILRDKDEK